MRTSRPISWQSPLNVVDNGVRVTIRLTPRARTERIDGITGGAFKVSVTAPPAENRANEALLRLLSREWRLPRRDLSIAAGARSRNKIVQIAGDPAELTRRITEANASTPMK